MKLVNLILLASFLSVYSCRHTGKKTVATRDNQIPSHDPASHPNQLFQNNCAMCHGYSKGFTAPAMSRYSVDSVLNYYDGKLKRDSVWREHKKIELTGNEWERTVNQMQPGDRSPK